MSETPRSKRRDVAALLRRRNETLRSIRRTVSQLERLEDRKLMTISNLTAAPSPFITVEGSGSQVLTITLNDNEVPIGFVNVNWGDGASDSNLYVGDGSGNATVTFNHAYAEEGVYGISIGAANIFDPT